MKMILTVVAVLMFAVSAMATEAPKTAIQKPVSSAKVKKVKKVKKKVEAPKVEKKVEVKK